MRENEGAVNFNGDPTNEQVSAQEQIGAQWEQVTELDGTFQQVIWDYTFEVFAPDGTAYRIAVIDVDLNNDNDLNDSVGGQDEDGFYLVFPDGVPPAGVDYTVGNIIENDNGALHDSLGAQVVCYAAGTLIQTPIGDRPIEDLRPGDLVNTADHGPQPILWAGSSRKAALGKLAPIVIKTGALGNARDLVVSPQHRMLVQDWRLQLYFDTDTSLVRAMDLVDDDQIYRRIGGFVTYHHFLLEQHEIVFAEGIPSESLMPGSCAMESLETTAQAEIIEALVAVGRTIESYGPPARRILRSFETALLSHPKSSAPRAICGPEESYAVTEG
ncbi:Hint domain-containing protein [Ruegeria arenilitoris]|uniref:Hint domain-containing protein n=1 Tax=Ruegeria arenilitoris TaxID=1173585 RepID=UPI00147CCD25